MNLINREQAEQAVVNAVSVLMGALGRGAGGSDADVSRMTGTDYYHTAYPMFKQKSGEVAVGRYLRRKK